MSDDPAALEQLQAMHAEALTYYEEHNLTELWLSDDENDSKQMKAPVSKKMHHDAKGLFKLTEQRPATVMRMKSSSSTSTSTSIDEREKMKAKNVSPLVATTPTTPTIASVVPQIDLSEESEDDTSKKTGVPHMKTFKACLLYYLLLIKLCDVCSDASSLSTNTLLECEDCGKAIHQKCNRPEVTSAQARDPRFLFVCCNCKDRDTRVSALYFCWKTMFVFQKFYYE
ncbi:unnamed protein product [Toxocara canis]|uniref:PHD-type domain-containing protein n=1 Tax=Toxocara canis TaxID=6265 RepID=A0A183UC11_TOXCA|nr:unnamed protein product [Toxocara canis]